MYLSSLAFRQGEYQPMNTEEYILGGLLSQWLLCYI